MKKIGAMVLAIMMIAMVGLAYADDGASLTGGKYGTVANNVVTSTINESVKIAKEITAYNVDETTTVYAPTISYTYTITADATNSSNTIVDSNNVSAVTKPGVLDGLKVNDVSGSTGTITWSTGETLSTSSTGTANTKYLSLDFSGVVFGAAGVYRYVITETLTTSGDTYAMSGVTETKTGNSAGSHVRYLDVYVKDGSGDSGASAWDVYGYVCMYNDNDINDGTTGTKTVNAAAKTNGFVPGTTDGTTAVSADSYYTFNLTISKTLSGDNAMSTHQFPFSINFTNSAVTKAVKLNATTSGTVTDYTHNAVAASSLDGIATLAHNGSIKYIGIPCGTSVTVFETNNVTGTAYQAIVTTDGTAGTAKNITWGTAPSAKNSEEVIDTTNAAYESNVGTVTTTADTNDNTSGRHTIAIANTLELISPTGYVSRFAPYALILVGGIVLLVIAMKRRKNTEED